MNRYIIMLCTVLLFISCSNGTKVTNPSKKKGDKDNVVISNSTFELPEVFKDEKQEAKFKALVGPDFKLFVTAFETISEVDDQDAVNAKVYIGMVPGLGTINECIIMITDDQFMAAVIDGDNIKYYSSNPNYKTQIPKTIQQWKERMEEMPIKIMQ